MYESCRHIYLSERLNDANVMSNIAISGTLPIHHLLGHTRVIASETNLNLHLLGTDSIIIYFVVTTKSCGILVAGTHFGFAIPSEVTFEMFSSTCFQVLVRTDNFAIVIVLNYWVY